MFVDRLLARFSIRTKVLIFVLPFIVSISAVGLIGLYASGLLQHRMEISNDTLKLLSGYRDVGSTMNQFLTNPGEQTRKAAEDQLKRQQDAMQAVLNTLEKAAVGRANIEQAFAATKDIGAEVGQLWELYRSETTLSDAVNGNLKTLMLAQSNLSEEATKLQRAVRKDESDAKSALRDADKLTTSSKFLSSVASQATAAGAAERQFPFLSGKLAEIEKTQRTIAGAMPKNQTKQADELAAAYAELRDRLATNDLGDENVQAVSAVVRKFRRISEGLDQISAIKSAGALDQFAKVDTKIVTAEEVLNGSRALISGAYELRIKTADFLAIKDEESFKSVQSQIGLIGLVSTNLDKLGLTIGNKDFFEKLYNDVTSSLDELTTNTGDLLAVSQQRTAAFGKASAAIDLSWNTLTQFADLQVRAAADERERANMVSMLATVAGVIIAIASGFAMVATLQRPIGAITGAMRRLAEGDNETAIQGDARGDEIGAMARALGVFRDNARAKIAMEAATEQQRAAAEADRARHDAEKQDLDSQIDFAVSSLAEGLERLANGDVSQTIGTPFVGRLEQLRQDFNRSLERLQDTLGQIVENVSHMRGNGQQMSHAADELSKRTESQAASLEQTAAAVDEITVTVRASAERARDANTIVMETRGHADNSVKVVADAIAAMGRIESASSHIEQIIDVIEDIAFQTNLLALNAGIEAARAGEAGKGFAVVAQEVRELAQRSASAAQEIKGLINTSATEVGAGARLVQQTGEVLNTIGARITTISEHVQGIATASNDQAAALQEVNGAVNQMDQLTQQNAAMVEETSASSRQLADDAEALMALVAQFRLVRAEAAVRRAA